MNLSFTNLLLYKSVPGVVVALAAPAEGAALTAGSTGSDRIQSQSDSTGPATRYYRWLRLTLLEIGRRKTCSALTGWQLYLLDHIYAHCFWKIILFSHCNI